MRNIFCLYALLVVCNPANAQGLNSLFKPNIPKTAMQKYWDSLSAYNRNEEKKKFVKWRLHNIENLGEYIRVSDSLGFHGSITQDNKDVKKLEGGAVILTKDDDIPVELVSKEVFGSGRGFPKYVYMPILKKPIRPINKQIESKKIVKKHTEPKSAIASNYDTIPKKISTVIYYQHNNGVPQLVAQYTKIDSSKSIIKKEN